MPTVSRWFIKAGIFYLLMGLVLSWVAELPGMSGRLLLMPVYWHMIVIGWITQVIMGVSIWMFPRKPQTHQTRNPWLCWLSFWTLNAGLLLRFLTEPFLPVVGAETGMRILVVVSAGLLLIGIVCYILEIRPRLFPREARAR